MEFRVGPIVIRFGAVQAAPGAVVDAFCTTLPVPKFVTEVMLVP